jgi:hypothetical protein
MRRGLLNESVTMVSWISKIVIIQSNETKFLAEVGLAIISQNYNFQLFTTCYSWVMRTRRSKKGECVTCGQAVHLCFAQLGSYKSDTCSNWGFYVYHMNNVYLNIILLVYVEKAIGVIDVNMSQHRLIFILLIYLFHKEFMFI